MTVYLMPQIWAAFGAWWVVISDPGWHWCYKWMQWWQADRKVTLESHQFAWTVVNTYIYNNVYSCSYSFDSKRANRHWKADGKNSCHAGAYSFLSASVPGSCSGDSQLWRPCEKLKGNFSCPANLTPLLRMNQKRNTLFEQKESERKRERERGRESERKSETSCLEVPHLYDGTAAHAHNCVHVWPQSNAQFIFTGISEMFRQGWFLRGGGQSQAALLYLCL